MPVHMAPKGLQILWQMRHNTAGQPILIGVVEDQFGLQACHVGRGSGKGFRRQAKLPGLGHVLGIENGEQFAAREAKRIVEGARLGLRLAARHDGHLELRRQMDFAHRALHGHIAFLKDELDVELFGRIVAALSSKRTKIIPA